ncbi:hypothetical protein KI387_002936, partial [Taxus chinensis]
VPVVMCPREGFFPGLYCTNILTHPWLSDGHTLLLSSIWGSMQVLLAINVLSGTVSRISPRDSDSSWSILAVQDNTVLAVSSSPAKPPNLMYGRISRIDMDDDGRNVWSWLDVSLPSLDYSEKVKATLSSIDFKIFKIPVADQDTISTKGAKQPFEAVFVSSKCFENSERQEESTIEQACNPLIVVLHGGPHSTSLTSYSRAYTFLSSLGFNLLHVNYRGSLGFGEEALQSLPGSIGRQDVGDVLNAIDLVIGKQLANPTNIAVLGGSHGGFLTTHLIGQAPDRFVAAAVRNPVCNLSLMVGTTDIPDWCYVETYGKDGKNAYTEAPTTEDLNAFYHKSPISHISKEKRIKGITLAIGATPISHLQFVDDCSLLGKATCSKATRMNKSLPLFTIAMGQLINEVNLRAKYVENNPPERIIHLTLPSKGSAYSFSIESRRSYH